jgi:hypothetical protein
MSNSNSTVVRGVIGVVVGVAVFVLVSQAFHSGRSVEDQIKQMAAETNKGLPKQIDALTRWDRVEAGPGKAYSYIYTVSKNLTDSEKQRLKQDVTGKALALPELQPTFSAGVTVWYKYYDTSGKSMLEFSVAK